MQFSCIKYIHIHLQNFSPLAKLKVYTFSNNANLLPKKTTFIIEKTLNQHAICSPGNPLETEKNLTLEYHHADTIHYIRIHP